MPQGGKPRRKALGYSAAVASAFVIAIVSAVGTGLGSGFLDLFRSDPPLVSSSAVEQIVPCGTQLFVRKPASDTLIAGTALGRDWVAFVRLNRHVVTRDGVVEVSIQGDPPLPITLTNTY